MFTKFLLNAGLKSAECIVAGTNDRFIASSFVPAGITLTNCKFLVTIFDDDQLNLKTSVRARILNSEIRIVAKAGIKQGVENLQNIGVDHVVDPFEIIANRINIAYRSPYLFNILNWINGGNLHLSKNDILPRGRHIVCSGGRFGVALKKVLEATGIS